MKCGLSLGQFLHAVEVGVVGSFDVKIQRKGTTVRFETTCPLVADRISHLASVAHATMVRTLTDEGLHVITLKGFTR